MLKFRIIENFIWDLVCCSSYTYNENCHTLFFFQFLDSIQVNWHYHDHIQKICIITCTLHHWSANLWCDSVHSRLTCKYFFVFTCYYNFCINCSCFYLFFLIFSVFLLFLFWHFHLSCLITVRYTSNLYTQFSIHIASYRLKVTSRFPHCRHFFPHDFNEIVIFIGKEALNHTCNFIRNKALILRNQNRSNLCCEMQKT